MAQLTMGGIPLIPFLAYRQEQSQSLICTVFYNYRILITTMMQQPQWAKAPLIFKDS